MGHQKNYPVASLTEARVKATEFIHNKVGTLAFGFVTDIDGVLTMHERWNQPCYGEMRPYGVTHKDMIPEDQKKVRKPGDLTTPFPDKGNPVLAFLALSRNFTGYGEKERNAWKDFLNVVLDQETSPWRIVLKDIEVVTGNHGVPVGIIFPDTHIPPTVLINLWMYIRNRTDCMEAWALLRDTYPDKDKNVLLLMFTGLMLTTYDPMTGKAYDDKRLLFNWYGDYYLAQNLAVQNFLNGTPKVDEPTFYERGAYNRPELHLVFGKGDFSINAQFKKALEIPGHQSVVFDNDNPVKFFDTFAKVITA